MMIGKQGGEGMCIGTVGCGFHGKGFRKKFEGDVPEGLEHLGRWGRRRMRDVWRR